MPSRSAVRTIALPRDRIVPLGLSPAELALVQTGAAGRFALVAPHEVRPVVLADAARHDVVHVASMSWWTAHHAEPAFAPVLEHVRMVLLLPAHTTGAQQRQLAEQAPRAVLVILGMQPTDALPAALADVRHRTVADALRQRLATAPDLAPVATRALCEAVRLLPHERTVPALARALFLTERTLRRQLECAAPGLTPRRVLGWATLLHMAWYLDATPDASFDRMAEHLGASSPANWRRLLRELTGLATSALRTGSVDAVVAAWVEQRGCTVPRADTKA